MRKIKSDAENGSWQRIEAVINYYQFPSVSAFSRHLGLKRPETLYQIKRGNNEISRKLAENICRSCPRISIAWLMTGESWMLRPSGCNGLPDF